MSRDRAPVRIAVLTLVSAALPLLVYVGWFRRPSLEDIARKESRLGSRQRDLRTFEVTTEKLSEFQRESAQLDQDLLTLGMIRPSEPLFEPLFDRLRSACGERGLDVLETKALPVGRDTAPLELRVQGTHAAFVSFLGLLPRLARLNRVERIQMERRDGRRFEFKVRIVAFYSKEGAGDR